MRMRPDILADDSVTTLTTRGSRLYTLVPMANSGPTRTNSRSFLTETRSSRRGISPRVGRWLSNDPIGISGGLNQYTAFGNNPVVFGDPWGERVNYRRWAGALAVGKGAGLVGLGVKVAILAGPLGLIAALPMIGAGGILFYEGRQLLRGEHPSANGAHVPDPVGFSECPG